MSKEFDCPITDTKVTEDGCLACAYYMIDESYTGCGFSRNGKRGNDGYESPKVENNGVH